MRRNIGAAAAWLLLAAIAWQLPAHETPTTKLTWNREISRLFEKRCMNCHSPGGAGPMPLTTYAEARPWAVAIKEEVLNRTMPPWPAAKGFGEFNNDISLPQEEINTIAAWAEGGAPEGDAAYARLYPKVAPFRPAAKPQGRAATLQGRIGEAVTITAIAAPAPQENPKKIYALLPGGRFEPLVWLLPRARGRRLQPWLILHRPLSLPAGTTIHNGPLSVMVR